MAHIIDHVIDAVKNSWAIFDQQTNAVATATRAAEASRHHVLMKCDASYSDSTAAGEITISFGATIILRKHIHGAGAIDLGVLGLQNPDANEAVSASLAAGGAAVVGTINLVGYTTGPNA